MGVSKNLVYLLPKPILMPFKDFLTLLEEKQTHNFWVHIRKEHKILVITHSCSLFWNIFKQAKNEQTLRPETSAHPFCPSCFFLGLSEILSLLSNRNRHKISEPIFGKSEKFWILLNAFDSHQLLLYDWKMSKYFVQRLFRHRLLQHWHVKLIRTREVI